MGKQYAILRVRKCKGAEIGAMQYHNDREPGNHTNPDIDQSRTQSCTTIACIVVQL